MGWLAMVNDQMITVTIGDKEIADELIPNLKNEGFEPVEIISSYDNEKQHVITDNLFSKRTFFVGIIAFFIILILQDLTVKSYLEVMVGGKDIHSTYGLFIYFIPIAFVGAILSSSIYVFILFLRSANLLFWNNEINLSQINGGEILIKYNYHPELIIKLNSFKLLHDGGVNIS
jgi:hypothetical protein